MTKEEIDAIIRGIEKTDEAEDYQQIFDAVKELCSICKAEDLWGEIQKKQNDVEQGNEEATNESDGLLQQLFANIHSQIPENLRNYYYIELMNEELDDIALQGEQKKKAEEAYDKYIEEIIGLDEDARIQASERISREDAKLKISRTLSDEKKIEVLKELTDEGYKLEIIQTIEDPNKKIEALKELTNEWIKAEVIKTIEDPEIRLEVALKELTEEWIKAEVIKTIEDPEIRLEVALKELTDESYKAEVIKTIEDPNKKIEALKELTEEWIKAEVIKTIEDPKTRLEVALKELTDESYKAKVIKTIEDPEIRLEVALKELTDEIYIEDVIKTIKDSSTKIEALKKLKNELFKAEVIKTIEDPVERLEVALEELKNEYYKAEVIKTIEDPVERLELALKELTDEWSKVTVIRTIEDEVKLQVLEKLEGEEWLLVAENTKDEKKLEVLNNCDENGKLRLIRTIHNPEIMLEALDELEGEYKEVLKKLYQKNNDVVKNIDIRILDECYLKTLGEDKINLISCFPNVQAKILNLSEKEYEIFAKCLNSYVERTETDEWTTIATYLLENLQNGEYSELIDNIEDIEKVDIEKLSKILQLTNDVGIKTVEDIDNYEEIQKKKCDEIIKSEGHIEEKKKAVLLKLFGQDMEYTKTILTRYGEDISSIEDGEEKDFVIALQEIMEIENEDVLRQIYEECEGIGIVDKTIIERDLKTAYGKKFNEGLYETKFEDIIEEKDLPEELRGLNLNVYDAGTDFKMIITSIAPFVSNNPEDFKKDWNRPAIGSQHFCASYIRNDMIGIPPVRHLCYGFSEMKEDALMLSGAGDIWSSGQSFVSSAMRDEKYYSPEKQINSTTGYNEMDFRRIQGGVKKQPDYIVAFKRNGVIPNTEKIKQAVKDWGEKLPIVIVDVDKCLEAEKGKVEELLRSYHSSKNPETAREILQKVRNNKVTEKAFCSELEEQLKEIEQEIGSQEEDTSREGKTRQAKSELAPVYDSVSAQERQEGVRTIKQLREKIQEMKKEGEEVEQ